MWESEDDVLRDIASLNDFGTPEEKESCKILYSVGRGLKVKDKPKISEKFIDSRTGEAISIDDADLGTNNTPYRGKGRGSLLGSHFRTNLQLQQQLRLARPLGSSDEAIETYYGRRRSEENPQSSVDSLTSLTRFKQNSESNTNGHGADLGSNKIKKRVIATRNSSSQANALITNLLSKPEVNSQKVLDWTINDYPFSNNIEKVPIASLNGFNSSDLTLSSEVGKTQMENTDPLKEINGEFSKKDSGDNFEVIDNDQTEEEEESEEENEKQEVEVELEKIKNEIIKQGESSQKIISEPGLNATDCNNAELNNSNDEKYRALGQRLNGLRLRGILTGTKPNESYNSVSFSECSDPEEKVIFRDEEFPPLRKS